MQVHYTLEQTENEQLHREFRGFMGRLAHDPDWMVSAEKAIYKAAQQLSGNSPGIVFLRPTIPQQRSEENLVAFSQRLTKKMEAYTRISGMVLSVPFFDAVDGVAFGASGWEFVENRVARNPLPAGFFPGENTLLVGGPVKVTAELKYSESCGGF